MQLASTPCAVSLPEEEKLAPEREPGDGLLQTDMVAHIEAMVGRLAPPVR